MPDSSVSPLVELSRAMTAKGLGVDTAKHEDVEAAIETAEPTLPVLPKLHVPNAVASMHTTAADYPVFHRHIVRTPKHGGGTAATVEQVMTP